MEYKALERLYQIQLKNSQDQTWVSQDLYRFLYKKEIYFYVYEKRNLDSIGVKEILPSRRGKRLVAATLENVILAMRTNSFEFRRLLIIENKFVSIQDPLSQLVQEILKLILESIYQSVLIETVHRNNKYSDYHTIVRSLSNEFENTIWFLNKSIHIDQLIINPEVLYTLLRRRINDFRFIQLIIRYLKSISSRVPEPKQNILLPILVDIYLYELDFFVKTIQEKYLYLEGKWKRRLTHTYSQLLRKISLLEKEVLHSYDSNTIHTLSKRLLILKRQQVYFKTYENANPSFSINYLRFKSEWILGITGNCRMVQEIKTELVSFLNNFLKLHFSLETNLFVSFKNYNTSFLNYKLSVLPLVIISKFKTYLGKTYYKRILTNSIKLDIPFELIISQFSVEGFCNSKGSPNKKKAWTVRTDIDILNGYNNIFHSIINCYIWVDNQDKLKRIEHIIRHSCICTLAYKHKSTIKHTYFLYRAKIGF